MMAGRKVHPPAWPGRCFIVGLGCEEPVVARVVTQPRGKMVADVFSDDACRTHVQPFVERLFAGDTTVLRIQNLAVS